MTKTIIGMPCMQVGSPNEAAPFLLVRRAPRERRIRIIVGGNVSCNAPTLRAIELMARRSNLLEQVIASLVVIPLVAAALWVTQ